MYNVLQSIVFNKSPKGRRRGNIACQRHTLTAQCTLQYTLRCTVHCRVQCLVKYMHMGCPCTHWVVSSKPVKIKLAKYSHVQQKAKFIITYPFGFKPGYCPVCFFGQNRRLFPLQFYSNWYDVYGNLIQRPRGRHRCILKSLIYLYRQLQSLLTQIFIKNSNFDPLC